MPLVLGEKLACTIATGVFFCLFFFFEIGWYSAHGQRKRGEGKKYVTLTEPAGG